jgi:four helix bundle protein
MKTRFDHEKLRVYQDAVEFCGWAGKLIESTEGKFAVKNQLDRASTSIVLNIAEGNGKRSHPDRCRFLDIARGSAVECAACLDVLQTRAGVDDATVAAGKEQLVAIVSMIAGLISRFGGNGPYSSVAEEQSDYGREDFIENENE